MYSIIYMCVYIYIYKYTHTFMCIYAFMVIVSISCKMMGFLIEDTPVDAHSSDAITWCYKRKEDYTCKDKIPRVNIK
jgi:hypothetical protein